MEIARIETPSAGETPTPSLHPPNPERYARIESTLIMAGHGLALLAPWVDAAAASLAFDALVSIILDNKDNHYLLLSVGVGLATLAPKLDAAKTAKEFDQLVKVLTDSMDYSVQLAAGRGLVAMAPGVGEAAAARGFDALIGVLNKTTDPDALVAAGEGMAALAPRLDAGGAAREFDALTKIPDAKTDFRVRLAAGEGLAALAPRLDASAAARGFDALILDVSNGRTGLQSELLKAEKCLALLAPLLEESAAIRRFNASLDLISSTTDMWNVYAAGRGLRALAPQVPVRYRQSAADLLLVSMDKADDNRILWYESEECLGHLIPRLDSFARQRKSLEAISLRFTTLRGGLQRMIDIDLLVGLLQLVDVVPFLVDLLREPTCVGDVKDAVLARLEELAFPPAPTHAASLVGLGAGPTAGVSLAAVLVADDAGRRCNRRFRTTSDAAAWVAEYHPEIDLDRPYSLPAK